MKKIILLVAVMMLMASLAYPAELLVKANKHWQDDWDSTKVNSLSVSEKESHDARSQLGDIIVVRPDGQIWGNEECLPRFVVVKVPELTLEKAMICETSLQDEVATTDNKPQKILKARRFYIKQQTIQDAVNANKSVITMSLQDFNNSLKGKNDKK